METAGKLTQDGNFSWMMVDSNHASVLMLVEWCSVFGNGSNHDSVLMLVEWCSIFGNGSNHASVLMLC